MAKKKNIREQIREMEAKKREQEIASAPSVTVSNGAQGKTVTFDQWWMMANKKVKLQPWLKEVIKADFKARGLGKEETEESFNSALALFGYKIK